jgi:hypothetical protein
VMVTASYDGFKEGRGTRGQERKEHGNCNSHETRRPTLRRLTVV